MAGAYTKNYQEGAKKASLMKDQRGRLLRCHIIDLAVAHRGLDAHQVRPGRAAAFSM